MGEAPLARRHAGPAALRRWVGRSRSCPPAVGDLGDQRAALLVVLDEAVAAQAPTDLAVAACGEPGPVPAGLAEVLQRRAAHYARLAGWLHVLPADGDLAAVREEALRLLSYHQWMVHQSANLAFAVHRAPGVEAARLGVHGLGAPADRLRAVRDTLRAAAPSTGPEVDD
ncbi:hypothetical protein ACGFX4_06695 [Kitasatospora sp. NPDC048365]|uniref:hypothetical protein n=1 Tax=Kitasatospora sp. NPDC048365 TaxID=3364050 RepID=UPI0037128413